MADKFWIARIVNTEGCECPLRARMCPGQRKGKHGCAFWVDEVVRNDTGLSEPLSGCLFAFQYVMGHEIVLESVRSQATVQQASQRLVESGRTIAQGVVRLMADAVPLTSGGARGVLSPR